MKKIIVLLLAVAMLLSMAACGTENAPKQRYPTGYIQHRCSCNRPFCGNDGTLR